MAFDGTEGAQITLEQGAALTLAFRNRNFGAINGQFYGKDILNHILGQDDCMGIRIYLGLDANGNHELVLVGANSQEDDLLDLVAENGVGCPPRCGKQNELNS